MSRYHDGVIAVKGKRIYMAGVNLTFLVSIVNLLAAQSSLPRFEDYPSEPWTGQAAEVRIHSRSERRFRTRLRQAGERPPNFASHYSLVLWGCGSNCVSGAIVRLFRQADLLAKSPNSRIASNQVEFGIFEVSADANGAQHTHAIQRFQRALLVA